MPTFDFLVILFKNNKKLYLFLGNFTQICVKNSKFNRSDFEFL